MKVKELIRVLKTYDTEQQIAVAWFCKEDTEGWYDTPPTEEQWDLAVENFENHPFDQLSEYLGDLLEIIIGEDNQ
tara:strand:+ start:51 stop:275 length:225 start_codon:yes stop_codon:yes gene_type:complete